jgi:hypothetical protein
MSTSNKVIDETRASLARVVSFDITTLPRTSELGTTLDFSSAVPHVERTIALFKRLPSPALDEFPENHLQTIKSQADQFYKLLESVLTFSASDQTSPATARDQIVSQFEGQYDSLFQTLHPYIAFGVARTVDFNRLESEGRAAVQSINDRVTDLVADIENSKDQIQTTLDDVRTAAAEQGVSQQAIYFKGEADKHEQSARDWLRWTLVSSGVLVLYCFASLFFHTIPGLHATDTYSAIQLGASKFLIFTVIAYLVLTCGRNFMAHTHNAIVNRHRQNGLQTFKTLVDAASSSQAQDIVLSHASASIFEPQETGYTKQQPQDGALAAASVVRSLTAPPSAG